MKLLTSAEAADYLRIKERKLYELVAEGAIPCTKVTGKWLFPRAELDRWLLAGLARPLGVVPAEPPPIVGGSHDPLLQWALSESRAGLAMLPEGSLTGYRRFLAGEVLAAAIHFHDLDDPAADGNVAAMRVEPALYDSVLFGFARREQGLLVAPGNPRKLDGPVEAARTGVRMALRPDGAGAHQLLLALLQRAGVSLASLNAPVTAPTGVDVAQAIRSGQVECGIATRTVAMAACLEFIPIVMERFDLLVRQRDSYRPPMQALLRLLREPRFLAKASELGGLDVTGAGDVRWAP